MLISDWSSDVCSSDLFLANDPVCGERAFDQRAHCGLRRAVGDGHGRRIGFGLDVETGAEVRANGVASGVGKASGKFKKVVQRHARVMRRCRFNRKPASAAKSICQSAKRSEEHTSELQSLMRISYAVFC